jgi:hypothetical protein
MIIVMIDVPFQRVFDMTIHIFTLGCSSMYIGNRDEAINRIARGLDLTDVI